MATAAVSAAMSLEGKEVVHPFFRNPKANVAPAVESTLKPKATADDGDASEPLPPSPTAQQKCVKPNGSKGSKRPSGPAGPKQATLDAFSLKKEGTTVLEPLCSDAPADSPGHAGNTLEEDPNFHRRKRQRTGSPESNNGRGIAVGGGPLPQDVHGSSQSIELYREERLRTEAGKGGDLVMSAEIAVEPERRINVQPPHSMVSLRPVERKEHGTGDGLKEHGLPEINLSASHDEAVSRADQEHGQIAADERKSPVEIHIANHADLVYTAATPNTRPAKLLQLKNGKLASPPKPKVEPTQTEPMKKRKPGRPPKKKVQRFPTIIKYPESSTDRGILSAQIDGILNGSERYQPPPAEPTTKPKVAAPKLSGPPKSTHPFFMGKAALKAAIEPEASTVVINKVDIRVPSPRKLTGTPGKIRAEAEAHRAKLKTPTFSSIFGSSQPRMTKYPGMREAPFPWQGAVHNRGLSFTPQAVAMEAVVRQCQVSIARRKLKHALITVDDSENLIHQCSRKLNSLRSMDSLRIPQKIVTTGPGIQRQIAKELRTRFRPERGESSDSECVTVREKPRRDAPHAALQDMCSGIEEELTPFDTYECETQAWVCKYAPRSTMEVLQSGKEAIILRDWLRSTTINAVDTGNATASNKVDKTKADKKKKKRKRAEDLDDFIVGSDDELVGTGELTELEDEESTSLRSPQHRSLIRSGGVGSAPKLGSAILLSGPNGCGKTAAVHAVAKELGFEVFELNSGSRRSGKDVLDKIGDMTENHLVQQVSKALSENKSADKLETASMIVNSDIPDIKQGSVTSFFKPSAEKASAPKEIKQAIKTQEKAPNEVEAKQQQRQQQRQSLILLEEVDILFEEDKQFWVTVIALAGNSKRPIIMTCNDESRLPMHTLNLHAILRFTSPPIDLAVDYLLLLAAREGHLLQRDAVSSLYTSRSRDLRGSIMELDYWCQMGVGDSTGGFEWMLDRYPPGIDVDDQGLTMRVASKDTYRTGMGLLSHDLACSTSNVDLNRDEALLLEGCRDWDLQVEDILGKALNESDAALEGSGPANLVSLQEFEKKSEFASVIDVSCGLGLRTGYEQPIDPTLPELSDKAKANYLVDMGLLYADPIPDFSNFSRNLAVGTSLRIHQAQSTADSSTQHESTNETITNNLLSAILTRNSPTALNISPLPRQTFSAAFDPLAESTTNPSQPISQTYPLVASSFDREFSIIVLDLAPYVRSIAAYDLSLEAERLKLSSLLSAGGRGSKKLRMTRASRSAVEGGRRETTRRERWFDKSVHLGRILETAGMEWVVKAGTDEEGSTREGSEREGSEREGSVREGSVREGSVREGSVREGSVMSC